MECFVHPPLFLHFDSAIKKLYSASWIVSHSATAGEMKEGASLVDVSSRVRLKEGPNVGCIKDVNG